MRKRLICGAFWLGCVLAVFTGAAQAQTAGQRPYQPYRPYRPTLTRYLDYFRSYNDAPELGGALTIDGAPSYRGFVTPREDRRQTLIEQQRGLGRLSDRLDFRVNQLDRRVGDLQEQLEERSPLQTIRRSGAAPTGTGGTFMNYSGYFQRTR